MIIMKTNKKLNRGFLTLCLLVSFFLIVSVSFAADNEGIDQSEELSISEQPVDEVAAVDEGDDSPVQTGNLAEVYVNSENGTSEGTGSADSPVKTIQEGISLVNNGGTIYLTGNFSGTGNSALTFPSQTITFIGVGNAVIDGNSTNKFGTINGGTYTFNNVNIINHYATGADRVFGGAFSIGASATVTFNDCRFENNGVFGISRGNGGAIDNEGTLNLNNCVFEGNYANISDSASYRKNAADGGAISNLGRLTINHTYFISNHALRNGGAIRSQDDGFLKIYDSFFMDNAAEFHLSGGTYGGAIYTWSIDLEVYNSTFINNRITETEGNSGHGGAISVDRAQNVKLIGCNFINNTANGRNVIGPSVYIGAGVTTVNYCTIDTQFHCVPTTPNLNYNWWSKNDLTGMTNLPSWPDKYAVFNVTSTYLGKNSWEVAGKLTWNDGTADGIEKLDVAFASLASKTGNFSDETPVLEDGMFKVNFTSSQETNEISAKLDNEIQNLTLEKDPSKETSISIIMVNGLQVTGVLKDVDGTPLENMVILTTLNGANQTNVTTNNKGEFTVNITDNVVLVMKFEGDEYGEFSPANATITLKNIVPSFKDTKIEVPSTMTKTAVDYNAGEKGSMFYFYLKDVNGNPVPNKAIKIGIFDKIYTVKTDSNGRGGLQINIANANYYTYGISFLGDDDYKASFEVCSFTL